MQALKAQVKGGRLVLDEPTNLPDGAEVHVVLIDGDDLDDEERAALHRELEASIAEADAGETENFSRVLAELRRQL
jgi:hypothetical protein